MVFENSIPSNREAFIEKVKTIATKLGIEPEWLMAVMWSESRLKQNAYNPTGGASGLIQFMPATAVSLGTSTQALRSMSNVDQLDYVYKYYRPYAGRMHSFPDVYLVTFFPAALGKSADYVLQTSSLSAALIAKQNPIFDTNKDAKITKGEFEQAIWKILPAAEAAEVKKKVVC